MVEENVLVRIRANVSQFLNVMKTPLETFRKMNQTNVSMINTGGKLANTIRNLTHGIRGFRMEMLGVMFFGMGISRFFQGLLKPALELVGVFDLWRITLQMLFLPIALVILQFMIPLFNWFMNLDESTKLIIGGFVLFGVILGTLTFLVGMFALGLGSLILALGLIAPYIASISAGFSIVFGIITAIIGIVKVAKGQWEGLGLILLGIGAILVPFIGWWAVIPIVVGTAAFLIIKHWEKVKNFFHNLWEEIKREFIALINFIKNETLKAVLSIVNPFSRMGLFGGGLFSIAGIPLMGNKGGSSNSINQVNNITINGTGPGVDTDKLKEEIGDSILDKLRAIVGLTE